MPKGSRRGQRTAEALAALRDDDGPVRRGPGSERVEDGYTVRDVGRTERVYRCPGCAQDVVAVSHVVAWPEGRPDDRRHWHTPCWGARGRRGPSLERSRNAPRF